jgi:protease-4
MSHRRPVRCVSSATLPALLALLALTAHPAAAQVQNLGGAVTSGLPLPVTGAAVAEEATALTVNPAGVGFIQRAALHYFHAEADGIDSARGDGLYAAGAIGPLRPALAVEWLRPAAGADYRITSLGLALSDGRTVSLGVAWRWWSSTDPAIEPMHAWDLGLTLRPWRHLSLGASALGLGATSQGRALPVRYDLGLGVRVLDDSVTLSADLLGSDRDRHAVEVTAGAVGLAVELRGGFGLAAQLRVPLRSGTPSRDGGGLISVTWNGSHTGITTAAASMKNDSRWLIGARLSGERYPASPLATAAPRLDLAAELAPRRLLILELAGGDPLDDLSRRLAEAGQDDSVGALVLEIGDLPLGAGRTEELRAAMHRLRLRKPVLAYLTGGGLKSYWLASAATQVAMAPSSTLMVNGLASSQFYLRDGLARLGVSVEVVRAGAYKTAPEPLTRNDPSPESREMTGALLDDVYGRLVADVARGRQLDPAAVQGLLDEGLFSAVEARAAGLVDEVLWPDELEGWARKVSGQALDAAGGYHPAPPRQARRWGPRPVVAVIGVEGAIAEGRSRREPLGAGGLTGARSLVERIEQASRSSEVKAIVLRIDSPGGDALASDLIWRAVKKARERKPVVASLGDLAASGGYLVAVGAQWIVAEPSTLTGSIGVFVLKPDFSGVLEKLAVHRSVQTRGRHADLASPARPWTPEERALLEKQVDAVYGTFLDRVVEGRSLSRAEVEPLAGGRVWTGRQALALKLVDQLGGLEEAVAVARERAGLPADAALEVRRVGGSWWDVKLAVALGGATGDEPLLSKTAALFPELRAAALLLELGPVLALPLEWVEPPGP